MRAEYPLILARVPKRHDFSRSNLIYQHYGKGNGGDDDRVKYLSTQTVLDLCAWLPLKYGDWASYAFLVRLSFDDAVASPRPWPYETCWRWRDLRSRHMARVGDAGGPTNDQRGGSGGSGSGGAAAFIAIAENYDSHIWPKVGFAATPTSVFELPVGVVACSIDRRPLAGQRNVSPGDDLITVEIDLVVNQIARPDQQDALAYIIDAYMYEREDEAREIAKSVWPNGWAFVLAVASVNAIYATAYDRGHIKHESADA